MSATWRRRAAIVAVTWALVYPLSVAADTDPQPVLLLAFLGVVALLVWLAADLADATSPARWETWEGGSRRRRGGDVRVSVLQRALTDIVTTQERSRLHPVLVDLIDDRLEAHHGIVRTLDPARARDVIGEDLSRFITDPPAPFAFGDPAFLSRIVSDIEQI